MYFSVLLEVMTVKKKKNNCTQKILIIFRVESCMSLLNTLKLMKRKLLSGHQVETYYIKMLEPVTKLTTVHIIQ